MLNIKTIVTCILFTSSMITSSTVVAELGKPSVVRVPPAQVTDRNYVNLVTGAVSPHLNTLSIGHSNLRLTHQIGTHGNYFYGYTESFHGSIITKNLKRALTGPGDWEVKGVSTGTFTEYFEYKNGKYTSIKNGLHRLVEDPNQYIYTNPGGTQYIFTKDGGNAWLTEIVRPDGFTIYISRGATSSGNSYKSITTNNGLQMKYLFNPVNSWLRSHPTGIVAVNNVYESCPSQSLQCELTDNWPTVTFEWSGNIGNIVKFNVEWYFKVTSPEGRSVTYYHEPYDETEGGIEQDRITYVPRISKIEDSMSYEGTRVIEYEYKNVITWASGTQSAWPQVAEVAVVKSANVNGAEWTYTVHNNGCLDNGGCSQIPKSSSGYKAISMVGVDALRFVPTRVQAYDGTVTSLDSSYQNNVTRRTFPNGNYIVYEYDSLDRLTNVKHYPKKSGQDILNTVIEYSSECTNPKTCNKPVRVTDPRGNTTDYEYHQQSGHLQRVVKPMDENGNRPETRYFYEEKYARFYDGNGNLVTADRPIWMLVRSTTCSEGKLTANGCSNPSAEVVVKYDYGSSSDANNLFLRGQTVIADGEERRTCYEYDKLGNRVGETMPRANLPACP